LVVVAASVLVQNRLIAVIDLPRAAPCEIIVTADIDFLKAPCCLFGQIKAPIIFQKRKERAAWCRIVG
jgi:hypothetical protein